METSIIRFYTNNTGLLTNFDDFESNFITFYLVSLYLENTPRHDDETSLLITQFGVINVVPKHIKPLIKEYALKHKDGTRAKR